MMLKNSFTASMKENSKRRIWVFAISCLVLFFYLPVILALRLNDYSQQVALGNMKIELLYEVFADSVGFSLQTLVVTVVFAVFIGIQGFSYLFHRKKMDMYASLPVSRTKRFLVIFIVGYLFFAIPYGVSLLMSYGIGMAFGVVGTSALCITLLSYVFHCIFFLAVYAIAIIAAMLTGNTLIATLAAGILLIYEIAARIIVNGYAQQFFDRYYYFSQKAILKCLVSPVGIYYFFTEAMTESNLILLKTYGTSLGSLFLHMTILSLLFCIIAVFLNCIRPYEACGRAISFAKTKGLIKIMIVIPVSLGGGLLFYSIAGSSDGFAILGICLGLVISACMIQIIYDFDFRSIIKRKRHIAYAGGITAIIYIIFYFDFLAYDSYVPKSEQVESAAVYISSGMGYPSYTDNEFEYISPDEYILENMYLEDVDTICKIAADSTKTTDENNEPNCIVKYRMKNGKDIYRSFFVADQDIELLDGIYKSKEYKETVYQIYNHEAFYDELALKTYYSNGGIREELTVDESVNLVKLYKQELMYLNYSNIKKELPKGYISFTYDDGMGKSFEWEYPVYSFMSESVNYLKKIEVYHENYFETEDIVSIEVMNYGDDGTYQTETYTEPEQINEIIKYAYSDTISRYSTTEDNINYSCVLYINVDPIKLSFNNYYYLYFQTDNYPEFINTDFNFDVEKTVSSINGDIEVGSVNNKIYKN